MDPQQQVKTIILMMAPEDPATQTDAVFLVQKYMEKMTAMVSARDKTIAMLEAKVEAEATLRHTIENEKLASETRLKAEKKQILDEKGIRPTMPGNKPGAKTI